MTRKTNARLAGSMYLLYIAFAFPQMVLFKRASSGDTVAARLASIAQHTSLMRWAIVLALITFVVALVLAVSLYALTRDEDNELAVLALCCRVGEGVLAALPVETLGLLWLATDVTKGTAIDAASVNALAALLFKTGGWTTLSASTLFAVGSTIFAYLFLRARSIPLWLAWLGVIGSLILVIGLPLQMAGVFSGPLTNYMWIPIAVFEVVLAFWLLIKGVAPSPTVKSG
jgi:hypothetical protein